MMKKKLVYSLLCSLIALQSQGMWRTALRAAQMIKSRYPSLHFCSAKTLRTSGKKGLAYAYNLKNQSFKHPQLRQGSQGQINSINPGKQPHSTIFKFRQTPSPAHPECFAKQNVTRDSRHIWLKSWKAKFSTFPQTSRLPLARLKPLAKSVTLAAVCALPYKAYAQAKEQSMQPASLWHEYAQGNKLTRSAMVDLFNNDCANHEHENQAIAPHTPNNETARIATYNVHMWKDAHGVRNFAGIIDTIKNVNADVLVLQEVTLFDQAMIVNTLYDLGYHHMVAGKTSNYGGNFFGNMMISKYPFAQKPIAKIFEADKTQPGEKRCFIKADIKLPGKKVITVYGTHLDVYDQTEQLRTKEIEELVADSAKSTNPCIIGADYNAVRKRDYQYDVNGKNVWQMLNENNKKRTGMPTQTKALETLESAGFSDSFTKNNQSNPKATVWSGTAVDFLYLNKHWNLPIARSSVYYSAASDHLPILMDVSIDKNSH